MSGKPVVVLDPHFRSVDQILSPEHLSRLHALTEVVWGRDDPMPQERFDEVRAEAFAVVCSRWRFGGVDDMPKLKAILETGGRHPSPQVLDYAACFVRGVRVLSCAPAFGPVVAELALGLTLAAARKIVEAHNDFSNGDEVFLMAGNVGTYTLFKQPVGFIGYGGLARQLRPLLAPFGCPIQVYDPWLPETYLREQGVSPVSLEHLLESSRVIYVLAIPSAENRALLDRSLLERIQKDAILILISRSHLVDFDALTDCLYEGRFQAAIDVFPEEPPALDHPIRKAPNVILSAHRAGSVPAELRHIGRMVVNDIEAMINGLPPLEMQVAQPEIVYRLE